MITCVYVIFFVISAVFGADENEAKLRFYINSFENYTEVPFSEATYVLYHTKWYNSSKPTKIFCHGFTGHPNGLAVTAVIKAILDLGEYNVVLLNWDRLAASIFNAISSSYLNWAIPNSNKVGNDFADTLMRLSEAGLDLNKTHLLGHSLGAHIMGMAGNKLAKTGVVLPWITGLDPAGPIFDGKAPNERLNPKSAKFVDVIHSDPNKYGSRKSLGTIDYWPNYKNVGHVQQPGCNLGPHRTFSLEDLCNHNKSWEFLIDAMKYKSILACRAKNYRTWKNYSVAERRANALLFGKFAPDAVPGNYYFATAAMSPYGLGEEGL